MSQDEVAQKIYNFLKEHNDRDYSVTEIAKALDLKRGVVGNLVRALTVTGGIVFTRVVSKAPMYQYKEALESDKADKPIMKEKQ